MSRFRNCPECRNKRSSRGRRGFSTIEMLVAVAVIGSLASVTIPTLASRVDKAAATACEAQRVTMNRALILFSAEHPEIRVTSLKQLVEAGYMDAMPRCPGGGEYLLMSEGDPDSPPLTGCSAHFWSRDEVAATLSREADESAFYSDALVYWDMESGGGDRIGDGNTSGVVLGAQWARDEHRGDVLEFDGLDDTVRLEATGTLAGPFQSFTMSAWIRSTEDFSDNKPAKSQKIISKNSNYMLSLGTSGDRFKSGAALYLDGKYKSVGGQYTAGTGYNDILIADNQWHHMAATYEAGVMTLYLDGRAILATGNLQGDVGKADSRNISNPIYLGSENGRSSFFKGYIDDFALFDRALREDEVSGMAGLKK